MRNKLSIHKQFKVIIPGRLLAPLLHPLIPELGEGVLTDDWPDFWFLTTCVYGEAEAMVSGGHE